MVTQPAAHSDADLLAAYKRTKDDAAFATLVSRHSAAVRAVALRATGRPAAEEDVAQATFLVLIGRLGSARRSARIRGSLRPWLTRTCRYCAANWRRSEQRRRRRETAAAVPERVDPSGVGDLHEQVAHALTDLRRRERQLIELHHLDGLPWRDVGDRLGLDAAAARVAGSRALDRLRTLLERRGVSASSATLATVFSALTVQSVRAALPTPAAFSIAKGTLVMLKLKTATVAALSAAALVTLAGTGGSLLLAQSGDGNAATAPAGNPSAAARSANAAPAPAGYTLAGVTSDGTEVRLIGITDGESWWTPSGKAMEALDVELPEVDLRDGDSSQVRHVLLDLVGGSAEDLADEFASSQFNSTLHEPSDQILPIEGGIRLIVSGSLHRQEDVGPAAVAGSASLNADQPLMPVTLGLRFGVGEFREIGTVDLATPSRNMIRPGGGFGSGNYLSARVHRLRLPGEDGEPQDVLQLTYDRQVDGQVRLRQGDMISRVSQPAGGQGMGGGITEQHVFDGDFDPSTPIEVLFRPDELVSFYNLANAPGADASPQVVVR